jgi:NADPH-dependent ferric siderophore reductase
MPPEREAARVSSARLLSPGIRSIKIAAESLAGLTFDPGADVAIQVPGDDGSANERHYSVWKSTADGAFELCIVLHGLGPGSRWAARCTSGDPVEILRSRALPIAIDPSGGPHAFFGDETSIASTDALIRALPAQAAALACFEVGSMDYRWPDAELARPDQVRWVDRAGRPGAALVAWLAGHSMQTARSMIAYVTGEARLCAAVHAHLVRDCGVPGGAVRAMPYWKSRPAPPQAQRTASTSATAEPEAARLARGAS